MNLENKLFGQWLTQLEELSNKIVGIYEQGSSVWGFADKDSDRDFVVIWQGTYPDSKQRRETIIGLGGVIHEFKDIPVVKKGVDMLEVNGELLNVAHIKNNDFFGFYEGLENLGSYYGEQLMRMGGLKNGRIHYDPEKKLENYKKKIKLTPNIVKRVRIKIKEDLEYDLGLLEIASRRGSTLRFLQQLGEVLNQLHIWYYMEKNKWLMSDKWFERFAEQYGWQDEFTELLDKIKERLDFKEISERLLMMSKKWGFEPSKKLKA